jgi:DNA-directed RNA polymerase beta' subunit
MEMNLHMPQDPESESELRNLAAVPYQIISPANNAAIIGIYQDSMLGCYRFTRENIDFTQKDAMNLLMMFNRINPDNLKKKRNERVSNFEILSQILPPLSLKVKNKQFDGDKEKSDDSNNVIEIIDGRYIRGQMDKGILGSGTKGLIHRVCNDYGNMAAADFIDDIQNIVTEYMKQSAFSVGISDLITDHKTNEKIVEIITDKKTDVKNLIDQVQIGVFENNSGKTNEEEFETRVNNILSKAQNDAGREALKNLSRDNRFVVMFNAGSKGSEINIQQMTACLGQQNVEGKRIPYGFEHRTLPHYTKFDDSAVARGFVESSYINGLSPQELFFHAMGGRIGLIDTAVKSVTWETPIVIIEGGKPKYTEIGKWVDCHLDEVSPNQVQRFEERQLELLNMKNGDIYIPTTDENGIVTWGEVTAVTRHDPGSKLYEIKTLGGRNVIVTESKSLLIWNKDTKKLKEMLTPEIVVGDFVPVTLELGEPPIVMSELDMTTYLPKSEFVYGTEFNNAIKEMNNAMTDRNKIPAQWWVNNNGSKFQLPYSKKSLLQRAITRSTTTNIQNGFIYPYSGTRRTISIPDTFTLNEENGCFIGLFLAEGNVHNNNICITNNDAVIRQFVKQWFDKHGIVWTESSKINKIGGLTTTVVAGSSILAKFLTRFVGHGAANKYVPTEAFISPQSFIVGILNGYYSGDGTISKNSVEVGSASKRLIEGITMLLSRIGVFGKVFKTQLKSNNLGTKNIKPTYRLSIRSQWGKIFANKVQLISEPKQQRLSEIRWNSKHVNFDTYNDVVLDKIVEINVIGIENHPKMYDLTIPSTLNFGLANGLQVRDTSSTGYIQRRLIKGLEDLMVNYDMTVRNNKNKIVQFSYGEDSIDTIKVENQDLPIVDMSVQDIYSHFAIIDDKAKTKALSGMFVKSVYTRQKKQEEELAGKCKDYIEYMIGQRNEIVKNVFNNKSDRVVRVPVAFAYIIQNVIGQQGINKNSLVDITMLEAFTMIEETYAKLEKLFYVAPSKLFKVLYYYYLSPKDLLLNKRFNKKALTILLETIILDYKRSIVAPGEMVGMIAAQSIGEPTTQMSLPFGERIRCVKINKITNNVSMVSEEIGQLCDGIIETLPQFTFNTGHHDSVETLLDTLDDEYYIVGVDAQEKTQWNKISHVSRHPVNGKLMRVTTRSGRQVTTTTSHSHLVRRNQTVEPIVGADMVEGMRIPVAKHIENSFIKDTVVIDGQEYKLDNTFGLFIGENLANGSSVPEFVFVAPNEFKATVIRSYFDLNANFHLDNQIRVASSSKQLIKDLGLLLNYFDIFGCITETNINDVVIYTLSISAKYILQYRSLIGTESHVEQLQKLVDIRYHFSNISDDFDKIEDLSEIITKCENIIKVSTHSSLNNTISRSALKLYIDLFESFQWHENTSVISNEIAILKQAADANVIWDEIVKIEIWTPKQTEYVYDFTVPKTQTFMTDYGVIVHNTLNTFHFAGVASKSNVTRGVPRIEEILSLSASIKNPSLTVFLKPDEQTDKDKASTIQYMLEHTKLEEVVKSIEICFDPDDLNTLIVEDKSTMSQYREFEDMIDECLAQEASEEESEKSKWIIRMEIDPEVMLEKNITMDDINFALNNSYKDEITCVYSDYNADKLVFRIRMRNILKNSSGKGSKKAKLNPLDQSDQIYILKNFQEQLLNGVVLRGIKSINKVILRKMKDTLIESAGAYRKEDIWVLDTIGTNLLDVLGLDYIDSSKTVSNDIIEIFAVLGMEAARQCIYNELAEVLEFDGSYVNAHHMALLCDRMTFSHKLISIFRHGINNDDIGPIAKASFEETPEMFLKAARHAELDTMRGISANVMCGQEGLFGTAAFQVVLDINEMFNLEEKYKYEYQDKESLITEGLFGGLEDQKDKCSIQNLQIQTNVQNIQAEELGGDNDYDPFA